ncbi:MAG: squalene/phytoene synthase family protein [Pseudomonadota bacterium]
MAAAKAPSPTRADHAQTAATVRAAGSSFYWAMRLQPLHKRRALFAVYAFCRVVDDIADGDAGVADPVRALERWVMRVEALYDDEASDALERCLVSAINAFDLRKRDFLAIIEGMMMDANGPVLRPDWQELTHYCDCVASAVGRLCIRIFGDASDDARALADHQGQALQLTNILRDIEEDAERGRIYVPRELLSKHHMLTVQPEHLIGHRALPAVRAELGAAAQARYDGADAAARQCDASAIRPAMMMMDAYHQKLDDWAQSDWHGPPDNPIHKIRQRVQLMLKAAQLWNSARA